MVSIASIISMCITLLVSLVLPIGLYVAYGIKNKQKDIWIAGAMGAGGFVLLQAAIRMEILDAVMVLPGFLEWAEENYLLYCLILAFTAGLFEVVARYGVAKILDKSRKLAVKLTYKTGVAAGIGHGGIEAVVVVGLTYVNNLLVTALINAGWYDKLMEILFMQDGVAVNEQAQLLYDQYMLVKNRMIGTQWYLFVFAGYERVLTMIAHIAMTLIVFYFVSRKKDMLGIIICLLFHTVIDFVASISGGLATEYLGNKLTENAAYGLMSAFVTMVAIVSVIIIIQIKKNWKPQESSSLTSE